MTALEKVRFLTLNYMFNAALEEMLMSPNSFLPDTISKAGLLNKYKPEFGTQDYPVWVAAVENFFKTI